MTAVQSPPLPASLMFSLRARLAAFASSALGLSAILAGAACTETPSYFPPCVDTAPCPEAGPDDAMEGTDGAPDAMETADSPADAPPEAH
jgi:hypothetical protein